MSSWCLQLASAVLGQHPEKPTLHLRRPRDGGGGCFAARHRTDLHGRLHQNGAQTQQSQFTQMMVHQLSQSLKSLSLRLLSVWMNVSLRWTDVNISGSDQWALSL